MMWGRVGVSQKDVHHCTGKQMQDFQAALSAGGLIEQISIVWKTRKYKTVGFTNICKLEFSQREEEEVLY
jgi:hypothetical protein